MAQQYGKHLLRAEHVGSFVRPERLIEAARSYRAGALATEVGTQVFWVQSGGYDTHASQGDAHASLLKDLSEALTAFYRHVEKTGAAEHVTVMVFSEFGRRVRENASLGTDHGCAAPMFLLSGKIKGGLHGSTPDFSNLDRGDLRFTTDFRSVYATVLEEVFGMDPAALLGRKFEKLPLFA